MTWFELAAVFGALAWLPQIVTWIAHIIAKPKVSFVLDKTAEIGFTINGPILNLTIAISNENKNIIIHDLKVRVTHESGEQHVFGWQGLVNRLGTMTAEGARMPFEKDQNAIAIKIGAGELEERFVRFQETNVLESRSALVARAVDRENKLKKSSQDYYDDLLASDEVRNLIEMLRHSNFWKPGTYECEIITNSTRRFRVLENRFSFTLSGSDVDDLSSNERLIEYEIEDQVKQSVAGYTPHEVKWKWANPLISRPEKLHPGEQPK